MSRSNETLFGAEGDREVWRVERDAVVVYNAYRVAGGQRRLQGRFGWKGGEEDQVRQWLSGGPDPK